MIIQIEQDIGKIKESIILGLDRKQTGFAALGIITGSLIMLSLYRITGYYVSIMAALPVTVPLFLEGFYKYQGLSFFQYVKKRIQFFRGKKKEYRL